MSVQKLERTKGLWRVGQQELDYVELAIQNGLTGRYTKEFERRWSEKFESQYAIGVNSGTSALHVALAGIGIKPGDEVIVPPLTFAATAFCVLYMGATPIFADIDPETFLICPESIEQNVTSKTKAIITVSLFGLVPAMDKIMDIAKRHDLKVVEDNAQCVQGKLNNQLVGTFGDVSIYSLQRSKHLTTGDGGVITTNDEQMAQFMRKFSDLGYRTLTAKPMTNENFKDQIQHPGFKRHEFAGYNFRLPEVVAAMGLAQLDKCDVLIEKRKRIGQMYKETIGSCEWLSLQKTPSNCEHSYWAFVLQLHTAKTHVTWEKFREVFLKNGGEKFYGSWSVVYLEPALKGMTVREGSVTYTEGLCPVAESVQPQLMQFKTNFEDLDYAQYQADILRSTIEELS